MAATKTDKETLKAVEAKNNIPEAEKKPLNKYGKQEEQVVDGVTYLFQFPGTRKAQQILDNSKAPGGIFVEEAYHTQLMEHVIVQPKLDWDYWDEHEGYREVMALADSFLGRLLN